MIESLTMYVLANDLPNLSPDQIRVFEHYNANLKPIIEWQEVKFRKHGKIEKTESIISLIINAIFSSKETPKYYVDDPVWISVTDEQISILSKID